MKMDVYIRMGQRIQPIVGTTNPERIKACCQVDQIELTREEWFKLYSAVKDSITA